jgi:hypothetical protein
MPFFEFAEPGPLGIVFADVSVRPDLYSGTVVPGPQAGEDEELSKCTDAVVVSSVRPGSLASHHPGIVPGMLLETVQGELVVDLSFGEALDAIKAARRPLVYHHVPLPSRHL